MPEITGLLDTSVILAIFWGEPGRASAIKMVRGAAISTINLSELVAKFVDAGFSGRKGDDYISELSLTVVPFGRGEAVEAGLLRGATRGLGLSLGDRACLATARMLQVPAVTADRSWAGLDLGIDIKVIR